MKVSLWFVGIVALYVTSLITANIIAVKLTLLFGLWLVPAGIIVFPLSYLLSDILAEVYGYKAARSVIWIGFVCNAIAVAAIYIGGLVPAAPIWPGQVAYQTILGFTPRLVGASFLSYLAGEFLNVFVLVKLKALTRGRWLWIRTIGSTLIGEGLDTLIFITFAFWGIIPAPAMLTAILTQWGFKVGYEMLATPLTYWMVGFLKRKEKEIEWDEYKMTYQKNFLARYYPMLLEK